MRKPGIFLAVLLVLALGGCAPAVDVEADEAAIRNLDTRLVAASNASDLAGWLALFTDDMVLMLPNEPTLIGKEAFRSWAQRAFEQFTFEETLTTEEAQVAGDWGFTRGTFETTVTPTAGGEPHRVSGKYLFVVKRQPDASWKYVRGLLSEDLPAAPVTEE